MRVWDAAQRWTECSERGNTTGQRQTETHRPKRQQTNGTGGSWLQIDRSEGVWPMEAHS